MEEVWLDGLGVDSNDIRGSGTGGNGGDGSGGIVAKVAEVVAALAIEAIATAFDCGGKSSSGQVGSRGEGHIARRGDEKQRSKPCHMGFTSLN